MPKDQTVRDILTCSDDHRDPAEVDAASQRLAAYSPAQIQTAKDELRYDHVGFDANKIDAIRRR